MRTYSLTVVTPYGKVFEDNVVSLSAPGTLGRFNILAKHAPLVSSLLEGLLKIDGTAGSQSLTIGSGVLEVKTNGQVLILTDFAKSIQETLQAAAG
ncbi:MAG: F0F1 ATP synthase subunit epsilon [Candidatus Omnitrophica bacterium]|nr:F0F1 ATP synthase subunit epsilon [Candidatus Omnitrophota bacterium]